MIRQQPISSPEAIHDAIDTIDSRERGETLYIQWKSCYLNSRTPDVELLENFIWFDGGPNDFDRYIDKGAVRAWKLFPNFDERSLPWN